MSSLAGALEEPVRYNRSYPAALPSVAQDVDVKMSVDDPEVKEEQNAVLEQAVLHRDGGDEAMDDLFGQEAEAEESKQARSETCASIASQ